VRLRLYHAPDGARVAYREAGTGPPLVLLHSLLLSHREYAPIVGDLVHRYRLVLPDLPLHGDSEDRPRHPYTLDWLVDVMSAFVRETCGTRAMVGGHEAGAEIALHAVARGRLRPERLVLLPNRLHTAGAPSLVRRRWRPLARFGGVPILDRAVAHSARHVVAPKLGSALSVNGDPAARDLVRHAFADVAGNPNLVRSWAKLARGWPHAAQTDLLDAYADIASPVLLLWTDGDDLHPLRIAEETVDLFPDAQLRVLHGAGFLPAYDDATGLARELAAFCG
jgi:pimeloyl-ACP methyl ester carboxylesterase